MAKRLILFFSILSLCASIFILITFNDSKKINRLIDFGAKMTLPYQSNQPGKCTPPNYVFPKEALISDEPLPDKVRESFKNVINITVCFSVDNFNTDDQNMFYSAEIIESGGTAYMFEQGLFISARHIFLVTISELGQRGYSIFIDKNGLLHSNHYHYTFYGTANIDGQAVTFPLELIAMGNPYRPRDLAVFMATKTPSRLKPLEFGKSVHLGEIVYSSGRVPSFNPPNSDLHPIRKNFLRDFINFNFKGRVTTIVTDLPNNTYAGFKKVYGIRTAIEPGFSGGPVFNKDGKIIGMTVSVTPGLTFSHAISAEDQQLFIQELRDKRIIPKK